MGGSMGGAVGTKFVLGVDAAIENKVPLICFSKLRCGNLPGRSAFLKTFGLFKIG